MSAYPPGGTETPVQHLALLRAIYIPGAVNWAADFLSRTGPTPGEWKLQPEVVVLIWAQFCMAQTKLFASAEKAHYRMWFSLKGQRGPLAVAIACFSSDSPGTPQDHPRPLQSDVDPPSVRRAGRIDKKKCADSSEQIALCMVVRVRLFKSLDHINRPLQQPTSGL